MNYCYLAIFLFYLGCFKSPEPKGIVLARIDEKSLTLEDIDSIYSFSKIRSDELPFIVESWVNNNIVLEASKNIGLDKDFYLIKQRDSYFEKLLISSFFETELSEKVNITSNDMRVYYKKNSKSFTRSSDGVYVERYLVNSYAEGKKLQKDISLNKINHTKKDFPYTLSYGHIKRGVLEKNADDDIFKRKKKLIGPTRTHSGIYVFRILDLYEKGDVLGFDEVYDEIYQRLYKSKLSEMKNFLIDSLKRKRNIYINPEYL